MTEQTPAPATNPAPPTPPAPEPHPVAAPPVPAWPPMAPAYPVSQPVKPAGFGNGFGKGLGAGIGFGLTLAVGLVAGSLVFGVLAGAAATAGTSGSALETVWGPATARNSVRAINVSGTILASPADGTTLTGGTYGYEIAAQIDAVSAEEAAGLLLVMNTPGGTINGSKAIADAVARYQERTGKKVVAHVQGMSASGGMYAMAGADEIIADYGSLVGSIGVISGPYTRYRDVTATTGSILESGVVTTGGITQEYLTMGQDKDFGNSFRDMTDSEREAMMTLLGNVYDDFVDWVASARGIERSVIVDELGAHIFDPETAIANGLIDSQLGLDEAYRRAAEVMGVDPDDTKVQTAATPGLLDQLLGAEVRVPGRALPAEVEPGQRVVSVVCGASPNVLLYHGQPAAVCG